MKDAPTRIQINKVDEKGNALKGVQLQVLDNTGKVVIPTWTTNGSPYEITGKLIVGAKYKLHEVSTLLEYNISRDVSFTVKDTPDVQTVKMINRKKTGQIVINKFDGSGQPIVGAQWKVYRKDNSELKFYRVSEGYFTYSESGTVTTLSTANISLTAVNMPWIFDYSTERPLEERVNHEMRIIREKCKSAGFQIKGESFIICNEANARHFLNTFIPRIPSVDCVIVPNIHSVAANIQSAFELIESLQSRMLYRRMCSLRV